MIYSEVINIFHNQPNAKCLWLFDVCLSVHRCICVEKKKPTRGQWFTALIYWTCFGHFYVHHQELETIRVLLPPMVCSAWLLVVGSQVQDSGLCVQEEGCCTTTSYNRQKDTHVPGGIRTHNLSRPAVVDPRLRLGGHRDRLIHK